MADLEKILEELRREQAELRVRAAKVKKAIAVLSKVTSSGPVTAIPLGARRRTKGRRKRTAAQKKAQSLAMKKVWAKRKRTARRRV